MKFSIKNMSPEKVKKLCNDYAESGLSLQKVAEKYHCSDTTVGKILKEKGIKTRNKSSAFRMFQNKLLNINDDKLKNIYKLYEEDGYGISYIAKKFKISSAVVISLLTRMGVVVKKNRDRASMLITKFLSNNYSKEIEFEKSRYVKCNDCGIVRNMICKSCPICFYKNINLNK